MVIPGIQEENNTEENISLEQKFLPLVGNLVYSSGSIEEQNSLLEAISLGGKENNQYFLQKPVIKNILTKKQQDKTKYTGGIDISGFFQSGDAIDFESDNNEMLFETKDRARLGHISGVDDIIQMGTSIVQSPFLLRDDVYNQAPKNSQKIVLSYGVDDGRGNFVIDPKVSELYKDKADIVDVLTMRNMHVSSISNTQYNLDVETRGGVKQHSDFVLGQGSQFLTDDERKYQFLQAQYLKTKDTTEKEKLKNQLEEFDFGDKLYDPVTGEVLSLDKASSESKEIKIKAETLAAETTELEDLSIGLSKSYSKLLAVAKDVNNYISKIGVDNFKNQVSDFTKLTGSVRDLFGADDTLEDDLANLQKIFETGEIPATASLMPGNHPAAKAYNDALKEYLAYNRAVKLNVDPLSTEKDGLAMGMWEGALNKVDGKQGLVSKFDVAENFYNAIKGSSKLEFVDQKKADERITENFLDARTIGYGTVDLALFVGELLVGKKVTGLDSKMKKFEKVLKASKFYKNNKKTGRLLNLAASGVAEAGLFVGVEAVKGQTGEELKETAPFGFALGVGNKFAQQVTSRLLKSKYLAPPMQKLNKYYLTSLATEQIIGANTGSMVYHFALGVNDTDYFKDLVLKDQDDPNSYYGEKLIESYLAEVAKLGFLGIGRKAGGATGMFDAMKRDLATFKGRTPESEKSAKILGVDHKEIDTLNENAENNINESFNKKLKEAEDKRKNNETTDKEFQVEKSRLELSKLTLENRLSINQFKQQIEAEKTNNRFVDSEAEAASIAEKILTGEDLTPAENTKFSSMNIGYMLNAMGARGRKMMGNKNLKNSFLYDQARAQAIEEVLNSGNLKTDYKSSERKQVYDHVLKTSKVIEQINFLKGKEKLTTEEKSKLEELETQKENLTKGEEFSKINKIVEDYTKNRYEKDIAVAREVLVSTKDGKLIESKSIEEFQKQYEEAFPESKINVSERLGFYNPNTKELYINRDVAINQRNITTGKHEVLHFVLRDVLKNKQGKVTQEGIKLIDNVMDKLTPEQRKTVQDRIDANYRYTEDGKEKNKEDYYEEYLTVLSENISNGTISFSENLSKPLTSFIPFMRKKGLENLEIGTETAEQMFNLIKSYSKNEGLGIEAAKAVSEAAKGTTQKGEAPFSKVKTPTSKYKKSELDEMTPNQRLALEGKGPLTMVRNADGKLVMKYTPVAETLDARKSPYRNVGGKSGAPMFSIEKDLYESINDLIPKRIKTKEDYINFVRSQSLENKILVDAIIKKGGVINNYIRSRQENKQDGDNIIGNLFFRYQGLTEKGDLSRSGFAYDPQAKRKTGSKEPVSFVEYIFANTRWSRKVSKKQLALESKQIATEDISTAKKLVGTEAADRRVLESESKEKPNKLQIKVQDFAGVPKDLSIKSPIKPNLNFGQISSKYGIEIADQVFGIPGIGAKIMKGEKNLVGEPARAVQQYYAKGRNLELSLKTMPEYNVSPKISKIGLETLDVSMDVQGRSIKLPGRFLDYFMEDFVDPTGEMTTPKGRSKGKTTQPFVKKLKKEFGVVTSELIKKVGKDIGVTKPGEPNIIVDAGTRTEIGGILKGMAKVDMMKLANIQYRIQRAKQGATKKEIADAAAGKRDAQFSEQKEGLKSNIAKIIGSYPKTAIGFGKAIEKILDKYPGFDIFITPRNFSFQGVKYRFTGKKTKKGQEEIGDFMVSRAKDGETHNALTEVAISEGKILITQDFNDYATSVDGIRHAFRGRSEDVKTAMKSQKMTPKEKKELKISQKRLDSRGKHVQGIVEVLKILNPIYNLVGNSKVAKIQDKISVLKDKKDLSKKQVEELKELETEYQSLIEKYGNNPKQVVGWLLYPPSQKANNNTGRSLAQFIGIENSKFVKKGFIREEHMLQYGEFVLQALDYFEMSDNLKTPEGKNRKDEFAKKLAESYYQSAIQSTSKGSHRQGNYVQNPNGKLASESIVDGTYNVKMPDGIVVVWKAKSEIHPLGKEQWQKAKDGKIEFTEAPDPGIIRSHNKTMPNGGLDPFTVKDGRSGFLKSIKEIYFPKVIGLEKYSKDLNVRTKMNSLIFEVEMREYTDKSGKTLPLEKAKEQAGIQLEQYLKLAPSKKKASFSMDKSLPKELRFGNEKSLKEISDFAKKLEKAMIIAKDPKAPKKGISVFDFDDTLARTKSKVRYEMLDGTKGILDATQFAKESSRLEKDGAIFDFSDFNKVIGGKKGPLFELAQKREGKFTNKDIFILTARPQLSATPIHMFLKSQGLNIPIENIKGLEDGSPQAKARWIIERAAEGYNDFYFADDAYKNVKAVQKALDIIDVKSDVQQAKFSKEKNLNKNINEIIEYATGIGKQKTYTPAKAQISGESKREQSWYMSAKASDFHSLTNALLGKGRRGLKNRKWFKDNLGKQFSRGDLAYQTERRVKMADYYALRNKIKDAEYGAGFINMFKKSPLKKPIEKDSKWTNEHAVRVYNWEKQGTLPKDISKTDVKKLVNHVNNNPKLKHFAEELVVINKGDGYPLPREMWTSETITQDILLSGEKISRKKHMQEFIENADIIFSEQNLNKMEAAFGKNWRKAMEDALERMKTGTNRPSWARGNKWEADMLDWMNGSISSVMFLNTRSALLQQVSITNYINVTDNNIFNAAKAFANTPQFAKDYITLMNDQWSLNRRDGLRYNIQESEIVEALSRSKNKAAALIDWSLKKGFVLTKYADSHATAFGGASFYRNRIKSGMKEGLSEKEAEQKAIEDWREMSDATQQTSRMDRVSQEQKSVAGRLILPFSSVQLAYGRRYIDDAGRDLINGRYESLTKGENSALKKIGQIIYGTAIQGMAFHALQQGVFKILFEDGDTLDGEELEAANATLDGMLVGMGVRGKIFATLKNWLLKVGLESRKQNPQYKDTATELLKVSPPIDKKYRQIKQGLAALDYDADKIGEFSLENPFITVSAPMIEAFTNTPTDRLLKKINNIGDALEEDRVNWQRPFLLSGWSDYNFKDDGKGPSGLNELLKSFEKYDIEKYKKRRRIFDKKDVKKIKLEKKERKKIF